MSDDIEVLDNGAKQSRIRGRYDLVDPYAMMRLASVLDGGAKKYGENNWRGIGSRSHINHALRHIYMHLDGDTTECHLDHAFCRLMMAVAVEVEEFVHANVVEEFVKANVEAENEKI